MGISKKTRFEVFKRDKFTCQYCGRKAPDVILHVDHIVPKAEGGKDDILNLCTSCSECNLGKGPREISDDAAVRRQRAQLEALEDRREQLEMMVAWQRSLMEAEDDLVRALAELWDELVPGYSLNENGCRNLATWIGRYDVDELFTSLRICANQYLVFPDGRGEPTKKSVEKAFSYIPKVCVSRERMREKPYLRELYYIRGIIKNRLCLSPSWQGMQLSQALTLMEAAVEAGVSTDSIKDLALHCSTWTAFESGMEELVAKAQVD